MPSGGAEDSVPPKIDRALPVENSLNVSPNKIEWTFSEYVNHATFQRALSITPPLKNPPKISWKGRTVQLILDSLAQNTTYVFKLDAGFADMHNVALKTPILYAFSTGNQIDKGEIKGRILGIENGKGVADLAVGLFKENLLNPIFTTKSDAQGDFNFQYLPADSFYVATFLDRNRNKTVDEGEVFGVLGEKITADSLQNHQIWTGFVDKSPPKLQRNRMLSERQFVTQFSENVDFSPETVFQLSDSLGQLKLQIQAFQYPQNKREIRFKSLTPLLAGKYQLNGAISDSLGNLATTFPIQISPSKPDTLVSRFIGFYPKDEKLSAKEMPRVLFSGAFLADSVMVTDTSNVELEADFLPAIYALKTDAKIFKIRVKLSNGKDTSQVFIRNIGGSKILGKAPNFSYVQLLSLDGEILASTQILNGEFSFLELLAGQYRLRLFEKSINGIFQLGEYPFGQSEKVHISAPIEVPANWEVEWRFGEIKN